MTEKSNPSVMLDRAVFERLFSAVEQARDRDGATRDALEARIRTLEQTVSALQVKAGAWGILGGLLPAVGMLLMIVVKGCA